MHERNATNNSALSIRTYRATDNDAVVELWRRCGLVVPWNDPQRDIERKMAWSPKWFLVAELNGQVVATMMAGYDGHRGWINYLAVDPAHRRRGIARRLMARAEDELRKAGCPKINLLVRTGNQEIVAFYETIGFSKDDVVSLGKRLVSDQ